jgi:hypothetical protein
MRFQTIAITAAQARDHGLPSNPEKPGEFQVEALPPDVLARIVREAVEAEVDAATIRKAEAEEVEERREILEVLDGL